MALIQPILLGGVGCEGLPGLILDRGDIYVEAGADLLAERCAESVRHGVVDGHVVCVGSCRRDGVVIGHPVREGGGGRETGAGHVVFHVVRQRVREHDIGAALADDRSDLAHDLDVEGQRHVIDDRRVELRAEDPGGFLGFGEADGRGRGAIHLDGATVARAEIEVVQLPAALSELEHRPGGEVFDVVGVREDGEAGGHGFRRP